MNIDDLEKFLVIAETQNLQKAAEQLDTSASVLSKVLKRVEHYFHTALFDRVGKHIQLNPAGELMRSKASDLVARAKQTRAEFAGLASSRHLHIAGPSILQFKWASPLLEVLHSHFPRATCQLETLFEKDAINSLLAGRLDLALVTTDVTAKLPQGVFQLPLGATSMQVAASWKHPLLTSVPKAAQRHLPVPISAEEVLAHRFAVPHISPYCGENRGIGCDGWHNDQFPRKQSIIANDYGVLCQLVRNGLALAYLPDYCVDEWNLVRLDVHDCPYQCEEQIVLVSRDPDLLRIIEQGLA